MPSTTRSTHAGSGEREHPILVVADHTLTGALVESLVEVAGMRPVALAPGERVTDAVARVHPELVLLDVDHAASADDMLFQDARAAGARLVLFSSGGDVRALAREGKRRGVSTCRLPVPHREFTALLTRLIAERSDRAP